MGIAALVLGIIAFIIAVTFVFAPLGVILAVVGLILGIVDTVKKGKTGQKNVISIVGLIICAIMFAVLIIESSIVVLIYNEASNTIVSSLDETAKNTFNSSFENYEGTQSGTMLKSLLNSIYTSNTNNSSHQITVYYDYIVKDPYSLRSEINSLESYQIRFSQDIDGYIYKVYITPESTASNNSIYSFNNSSY